MWKQLLSVRALKSGKGWNVIWEVQVSGKPGRTFLSSKKHSFLVDWFRIMMTSAEPNFLEQIPKMRRMSRLLWFESLNISSWDLIKLQSQVLFKTFSISNTHIQRTTSHEYLWQARFLFLKLTLYTCTFCGCLGWWDLFKSWVWGFPQIGLWGLP